jgi:hypothetical protein
MQLLWIVARYTVTSPKDIRRGQWQHRWWQEIPDPQTGPADGGNFTQPWQFRRAIGRSENRAAEGLRRDDATMRRQRSRQRLRAAEIRPLGGVSRPQSAARNLGSPASRPRETVTSGARYSGCAYCTNSPHFCTDASAAPHGMIGTEEVEFLGDPSISLSEYTM